MFRRIFFTTGLAAAWLLSTGQAFAAPGDTVTMSGSASASVVEPGRLTKINDLRFGQFVQPATSGTLTIAPGGAVTPTGGMTTSTGLTQVGTGRGPALFRVSGAAFRFFHVKLPKSITISNGAATMTVDTFTSNALVANTYLDTTGNFDLYVGGQLQVNAAQQQGAYSGTFAITVTYF